MDNLTPKDNLNQRVICTCRQIPCICKQQDLIKGWHLPPPYTTPSLQIIIKLLEQIKQEISRIKENLLLERTQGKKRGPEPEDKGTQTEPK